MGLEMVFNEMSTRTRADSIPTARERMKEFVLTLRKATSLGVARVLRVHSEFYQLELAYDYTFMRWQGDRDVDIELRRYMRVLATKAPFLQDLEGSTANGEFWTSEFRYGGDTVQGLGVAFVLEALAVSLAVEEQWRASRISLVLLFLDQSEDFEEETIEVMHACSPIHVDDHADWILERLDADVKDGSDLWDRRAELLPGLAFCDSVADQICALRSSDPLLHSVYKRLSHLNLYSAGWTDGAFDPEALPCNVSVESARTLEQYGNERTFHCPDGQWQRFTWHARLAPLAWRVYFSPENCGEPILIGYVGPHLPTVSDPT